MKTMALFMVLLVGCGRGVEAPVASDATFIPYTRAFDDASKAFAVTPITGAIAIHFGLAPYAGEAGYCYPGSLIEQAHIVIDKTTWVQLTQSEKAALIFHELGHCVLHQSHRSNSIMSPSLLSGSEFMDNESHYIDELFQPNS